MTRLTNMHNNQPACTDELTMPHFSYNVNLNEVKKKTPDDSKNLSHPNFVMSWSTNFYENSTFDQTETKTMDPWWN